MIQTNDVIGKNEDGSDITQNVDVLVWDVGQVRFSRITVMDRQFLDIPVTSTTIDYTFSLLVSHSQTCANICLKVRQSPSCGLNGGLPVFLLVDVIFT